MSLNSKLEQLGVRPQLALPGIVLAGTILLVWIMMNTGKQVDIHPPEKIATPIDAYLAFRQKISFKVHSQGTIKPRTESVLVSQVDGVVSWVAPDLVAGGHFKQGDSLLTLDDADYQTSRIRSEAAVTRLEAELANRESELQRIRNLHTRKLASQAQLENAERDYAVAKANLAEARANLEQAIRNIARTQISAPYTGRVQEKYVDHGQFVTRGSQIAAIYATDFLEVRLPLADTELEFMEISKLVAGSTSRPEVILSGRYAGKKTHWKGVIDRLEASIDTRSRMVYAVARILSTDQDPPIGLFVTAEVSGREQEGVFIVPRIALRDEQHVLVVNAEKVLESREVEVLRIQEESIVISDGLQDGDVVSLSRSPTLSPGSPVTAHVLNAQPGLQLEAQATDQKQGAL